MNINLDTANICGGVKYFRYERNKSRNSASKNNISFSANPAKLAEEITLLNIIKIQQSIETNMRALNIIINGLNNPLKANVSVTNARKFKNSASHIYNVFSLCGPFARGTSCANAGEYSRLSELLSLPGDKLSRLLNPDESMQVAINPETISADLTKHKEIIRASLLSLQNPETKDVKDNVINLKKAGDVLRQASVYFYALGAHFYNEAGNKPMADMISREAKIMASFQNVFPY